MSLCGVELSIYRCIVVFINSVSKVVENKIKCNIVNKGVHGLKHF